MTYLIALDDGHGIETSGKRTPTLPDGLKSETGKAYMNENLFNRAVVKHLDAHLRRCGFKTLFTASTDEDTPLATRVKIANDKKADAFVSIHANAASGIWSTAQGVETFVGSSAMAKKLGNCVQNQLIKGTQQKNRGVKDGTHLYVIRNTIMPAILVEAGFMDNLFEAKLLLSDSFRKECALEIAKGICEAFNVPFAEEKSTTNGDDLTVTQYKELLDKINQLEIKLENKLEKPKPRAASPSHLESWEWLKNEGLTIGTDPQNYITREQFATILAKFYDKFIKC